MKKLYLAVTILDFVGGICFLLCFFLEKAETFARYENLVSSICLLISGACFLHIYLRSRKEK